MVFCYCIVSNVLKYCIMFLINKSITFILLTKRNAKNYTIHPPGCTILLMSWLLPPFMHLPPATILTNDPFFPSFYMQPTILPIILFVCCPELINPCPTIWLLCRPSGAPPTPWTAIFHPHRRPTFLQSMIRFSRNMWSSSAILTRFLPMDGLHWIARQVALPSPAGHTPAEPPPPVILLNC